MKIDIIENVIFIISITLQVCGAGLISSMYLRKIDKQLSSLYYGNVGNAFIDDDKGEPRCCYDEKLNSTIKNIIINRISFMMIAIGILIGILGEIHFNKLLGTILILLLSIILFIVIQWLVGKIVGKIITKNRDYYEKILKDNIPAGSIIFGHNVE